MKEGQDVSIAERPRDESKLKRYLRYAVVAFFLIFIVAVIIGAVAKRFGG